MKIDLNAIEENGMTGFHYACERGHSGVVKIIMENAAALSIDLNAKCTDYSSTGFHRACGRGHSDVIKIFLENELSLNLDLNSKDCFDWMGFHHACRRGHMGVVKILTENTSSSNKIKLLKKLDLRVQARILETLLLFSKDQIKPF